MPSKNGPAAASVNCGGVPGHLLGFVTGWRQRKLETHPGLVGTNNTVDVSTLPWKSLLPHLTASGTGAGTGAEAEAGVAAQG